MRAMWRGRCGSGSHPFGPEQFTDDYRDAMQKLIEAKVSRSTSKKRSA